ncbi:hypothetical protein L207DRAFT_582205 [Hyaloscypha variabilis F]|uniref:Uncharacterized protein n=1 Tax=Hyaloscypha variabilis (strain UAMH 11265 / GT02V1 / F) TaxID=1149755 RepID=A0A2J6RTD8_HYAVF|nr:hypothetical protein L207DRAFT_582205 [Hyaloscypha variabilis F]
MKAFTIISTAALATILLARPTQAMCGATVTYYGYADCGGYGQDGACEVLYVMATDNSNVAGNFTQIGDVCQDMSNTGGAYIDWASLCTVDSGGAENCPCKLVGGGIVEVVCSGD